MDGDGWGFATFTPEEWLCQQGPIQKALQKQVTAASPPHRSVNVGWFNTPPIPSCERTVPLTCTTLALIRQKTGIAVNVSWTTSG
jgi:hypothetical protein